MADRFLLHVFDPLCGWCHAFHPVLAEFSRRHPELPVQVVTGGLIVGKRVGPAREHAYIGPLLDPMTKKTGVQWGPAFRQGIMTGELMLDSEAAGRLFVALRRLAPQRTLDIAGALHEAHFLQGWDLRDEHAVRFVAARLGLDVPKAVELWKGDAVRAELHDDFAAARSLGVDGFPTLILVDGEQGYALSRGWSSLADVERRFATAPAGGPPGAPPG